MVLKKAEPALVTEQKLTHRKDEIRLTKKGIAVLRLMRAGVEAELSPRLETLAEEEREALNTHFERKKDLEKTDPKAQPRKPMGYIKGTEDREKKG